MKNLENFISKILEFVFQKLIISKFISVFQIKS